MEILATGSNAFLTVLSEDGGRVSTFGRKNRCSDHLGQMLRSPPMGTGFQVFPGSIRTISLTHFPQLRSKSDVISTLDPKNQAILSTTFSIVFGLFGMGIFNLCSRGRSSIAGVATIRNGSFFLGSVKGRPAISARATPPAVFSGPCPVPIPSSIAGAFATWLTRESRPGYGPGSDLLCGGKSAASPDRTSRCETSLPLL